MMTEFKKAAKIADMVLETGGRSGQYEIMAKAVEAGYRPDQFDRTTRALASMMVVGRKIRHRNYRHAG